MSKTPLVVVGAHLSGAPLNHQLTDLEASFNRALKTAAVYRLYALETGPIPKPGLIRVGPESGCAYEVEVWDLPLDNLGRFLIQVPTPLCLGTVHLSDGTTELGFLCESIAVEGARDISHLSGWRQYMAGER